MLVDKIMSALEQGDTVLGVFLDFSKAFDTVDHDILRKKFSYHNVDNMYIITIGLLASLTLNVVNPRVQSSVLYYFCSILMISIVNCLFYFPSYLLMIHGQNPGDLVDIMNTELENVVEWLRANKLTINIGKTLYVLCIDKKAW